MKLSEFGEVDLNLVEPKSKFELLIAQCSIKKRFQLVEQGVQKRCFISHVSKEFFE
jgi:hypothetical protein